MKRNKAPIDANSTRITSRVTGGSARVQAKFLNAIFYSIKRRHSSQRPRLLQQSPNLRPGARCPYIWLACSQEPRRQAMDFSFFVISLKRTPDRLEKFRASNAGTAIRFEHFEAIDGVSMDSSARAAVVAPHATGYTPGALGIAASHRALWLRCSEQQNPFVICEDDAVLREDILDQLPRVVSGADDWISSCSSLTLTWGLRPRSCRAF